MHNLYLLIYTGQHVGDGEAVVLSFLKRSAVDRGPWHVEQMVRALIPVHRWNRSILSIYTSLYVGLVCHNLALRLICVFCGRFD